MMTLVTKSPLTRVRDFAGLEVLPDLDVKVLRAVRVDRLSLGPLPIVVEFLGHRGRTCRTAAWFGSMPRLKSSEPASHQHVDVLLYLGLREALGTE